MGFQGRWHRLWDLDTPEQAAETLIEFCGSAALEVSEHCGLRSYADDKHDDCLFWLAVYNKILEREKASCEGGPN